MTSLRENSARSAPRRSCLWSRRPFFQLLEVLRTPVVGINRIRRHIARRRRAIERHHHARIVLIWIVAIHMLARRSMHHHARRAQPNRRGSPPGCSSTPCIPGCRRQARPPCISAVRNRRSSCPQESRPYVARPSACAGALSPTPRSAQRETSSPPAILQRHRGIH